MTFAIATDSIGVADLRAMRARFGQGLPLQPQRVGVVPVGRPVVVELITAITANDYSQHLAKLLTLSNGSWIDTAQRVYVRCISDETAAAETRFIAEPVAGLGLCFDICSCGYLDAITISCGRAIKLVGQIAAATGLEDTDWDTDVGSNLTANDISSNPLYCTIDGDSPPTIVGDAFGNPDVWVRNMMPLRWELGDVYAGTANTGGFSVNHIELEDGWHEFAMCDTTPPADSHLAPMRLTSIDIDVPIAANVDFDYGSKLTHYRVWVGGVDVTGVVPVNWGVGHRPPGFNSYYPGTVTLTIPGGVVTEGESVYIDLWVQFRAQDLPTGDFWTAGWSSESQRLVRQYNGVPLLAFLASLNSANANLNRRRDDLYELTFSNNGPGGVSSLVLEPQAGWDTFDVGSGGILMAHQSTQDYVYFNWSREIPELVINIQARSGKPDYRYSGEVRFYPVPDGNYEYASGNWFGTQWVFSYGAWDCQGLTTFAVQGRRSEYTNRWLTKVTMPSQYWADWFGFHPTTITVEKV